MALIRAEGAGRKERDKDAGEGRRFDDHEVEPNLELAKVRPLFPCAKADLVLPRREVVWAEIATPPFPSLPGHDVAL